MAALGRCRKGGARSPWQRILRRPAAAAARRAGQRQRAGASAAASAALLLPPPLRSMLLLLLLLLLLLRLLPQVVALCRSRHFVAGYEPEQQPALWRRICFKLQQARHPYAEQQLLPLRSQPDNTTSPKPHSHNRSKSFASNFSNDYWRLFSHLQAIHMQPKKTVTLPPSIVSLYWSAATEQLPHE